MEATFKPFISVIIPAYNAAGTISRTLESAACQTIDKLEIIVIDDASTDATAQAVADFHETDHRVRYILRDKNGGVSAARNTGIRAAKGEYIAFLDADDVWEPIKLHNQIKDLAQSRAPKEVFSVTYYKNVEKNGQNVTVPWDFLINEQRDRFGHLSNIRKYTEDEVARGVITHSVWFGNGSTLLAHRDAIKKNGGFLESKGYAEESEYIARHIMNGGRVRALPEFLMLYTKPENDKNYTAADGYYQYIAIAYADYVGKRWGPAAERRFRADMDLSSASYNLVRHRWFRAFKEASSALTKAPIFSSSYFALAMAYRAQSRFKSLSKLMPS